MSTIPSASPRPSISSIHSSTTDTAATTSDRTAARRNKAAALRDYYGLRNSPQPPVPPSPSTTSINEDLSPTTNSELDQPNFSPEAYVSTLLSNSSLDAVVRTQAGLLTEIRTLDGEKKALVYDNYSKLIAATETIRKMTEKMDGMGPTTSTLTPAVGHIAEQASELAGGMRKGVDGVELRREVEKERERETVRWVLGAPERLRSLRDDGRREQAEKEWKVVEGLLGKWKGVGGVENVRKGCLEVLQGEQGSGVG